MGREALADGAEAAAEEGAETELDDEVDDIALEMLDIIVELVVEATELTREVVEDREVSVGLVVTASDWERVMRRLVRVPIMVGLVGPGPMLGNDSILSTAVGEERISSTRCGGRCRNAVRPTALSCRRRNQQQRDDQQRAHEGAKHVARSEVEEIDQLARPSTSNHREPSPN